MLPSLFAFSFLLFACVTWFCKSQGLFAMQPPVFAFVLYAVWFVATALALVVAIVVHLARA